MTDEIAPTVFLESASQTAGRLRDIKAALAQMGFHVRPGSRLDAFERLSHQFEQREITAAGPKALLELLLETSRDFGELSTIVSNLLPMADRTCLAKLDIVLGGAALPRSDRNPNARSHQFELFVAACLVSNGYRVRFEEPDLVVELPNLDIGIAAKRISRSDYFGKRVRQAGKQLRASGKRGIVAISLDQILPLNAPLLIGSDVNDIRSRASGIVPFFDTFTPQVASAIRDLPVIALLGSAVLTAVVPNSNQVGRLTAQILRVVESRATDAERIALLALASSLSARQESV